MRLRPTLCSILALASIGLAGCTTTVSVADGTWTATCINVAEPDCAGIGDLFVNNLARNGEAIRQESGGVIQITALSTCPPIPDWAVPGACWRASAPTRTTRACMVIARQRKDTTEFGFGQIGGDQYTGIASAPEPGTTPC